MSHDRAAEALRRAVLGLDCMHALRHPRPRDGVVARAIPASMGVSESSMANRRPRARALSLTHMKRARAQASSQLDTVAQTHARTHAARRHAHTRKCVFACVCV